MRIHTADPSLAGAISCVEISLVDACAEQPSDGSAAIGARRVSGGSADHIEGLGRVAAGSAGVYVRACDGCRVVAAGCTDARLHEDGSGDIAVTLVAVDGPPCSGICGSACRDASIDAPEPDAGGCTIEGERCAEGGVEGMCRPSARGLACCTGCWDGSTCVPPGAVSPMACGTSGERCTRCMAAADRCELDVCSGGACMVDYFPGTCGPMSGGGECMPGEVFVDCIFCGEGAACGFADGTGGTCRGSPGARTCCMTCWDGTRCLDPDELGPSACGARGEDCAACPLGCDPSFGCR